MNKLVITAMALAATLVGATVANAAFDISLSRGAKGAEVVKLQDFLIGQGHLRAGLNTGNFLSLTEAAVKAFQTASGIESIGIFGPKTRAAANLRLASTQNKATISNVSIKNNANVAAAGLAASKTISWSSANFPVGNNVSINLLRKTSSTPNTFTLVRQIAKDVGNTGFYTWIMQSSDTGSDLYIEIACQASAKFPNGCSSSGPIKVN